MSTPTQDAAKPVRAGEELDLDSLATWLSQSHAIEGPIELQQFHGGYSNLTYLIRIGERELVLRRGPPGHEVKSGHDMGREFRVLQGLARLDGFPAPAPIAFCEDPAVIGSPFYLMERVAGVIVRRRPPKGMVIDASLADRMCRSLLDTLVMLHAVDVEAAGLSDLGKPTGYVERQVEGWIRRYERSKTDEVAAMDELAQWLRSRKGSITDDGSWFGLVHNDYKFDNLVLDADDPARVLAILDWEMCTVGHPLTDLGTLLAYWVQADDPPEIKMLAFGPTHIDGMWTRAQLVEQYEQACSREIADGAFFQALGIYKVATIVQQIYWRYVHGKTKDPRFAPLGHVVNVLAQSGVRVVESDRVI